MQPSEITCENAAEKLAEHLPEVREKLEAVLERWGEEKPGVHVVYGDILNPYIDELLASGDAIALQRVFDFLERLALSSDLRLKEVVAFTICEYLVGEKLSQARRFMGPATLELSDEVEEFWGRA